jgi:hypothetical protein
MTIARSAVGSIIDKAEVNATYLVVTALDTTATINGSTIDNRDGQIKTVAATFACSTNSTGTNPTCLLKLQGSNDGGATYFTVTDSAGTAYATSATATDTAATTAVVLTVSTSKNDPGGLPAVLRFVVVQGGTNPASTFTVGVTVNRDKYSTVRI